jgi:hypothetical protein
MYILIKTEGNYVEYIIEHQNAKNLAVIGESKEKVIITCAFNEYRKRLFLCIETADLTIKKMTIINTYYLDGNIIIFNSTGKLVVEDCILKQDECFIFYFNEFFMIICKDMIRSFGANGILKGSAEIKRSEFINFFLSNSNSGGAFYLQISDGNTMLFEDCNFINCRGGYGGNIGRGGGIFAFSDSTEHTGILKIIHSNFSLCRATEGGGVLSKGLFI